MGKPKKSLFQQKDKKSKRKAQISKMNDSDDQQVDDVMAWGRKRQNYYKQDEDQYSSLSQQQKQAQQIYKNRYENYLNDQDAYDVPQQKNENQNKLQVELEQNLDQQQKLPEQYIRQQLEWSLELFKDLQFYEENNLLRIYEKLLKSYLTTIISIKQLKIPYIQYHPIIPMAVDIKTKITKLMKKLTVKEDDQQEEISQQQIKQNKKHRTLDPEIMEQEDQQDNLQDEEQFDQEEDFQGQDDQILDQNDWDQSQQNVPPKNNKKNLKPYPDHCTQASKTQKQQHKKGIQFYNSMKAAHQQQKKKKKQQKRQQRKTNKKPAFKQLSQNQGRFASQLILKNKGLIKKRKKIQGNSRVKLRKKYQKKKSIHRARSGHFIRQNPGRAYQGESNIRTGKIAGVKLK